MKHIFTLLLLIAASTSFAQIKVEGVVKDSIGAPLELANVIAINQETKALDSYGITNDQGRFKLTSLKSNTAYKLQVSYIGMKTFEEVITTSEANINKDFNLLPDNNLDAVELTYEMPVTISGDTLIYNADSFKSGTERKLEDVLKKLPGVEVNEDGQIEVEGKQVSKVMVEGKDFFDGDSKLATKNIPASAIDKVQVLKNYAEVGQLSGVTNNQDNIAINIKLKEGKNKFWFGNVTAGGGGASDENDLYLIQPKLFYYSPKGSINVIGDLNNIGELAFTRRDYWNFSGGFNRPSRRSGTNISLGDNGLGFLQLQNNRAKDINTKFGAANFSYSPNKALDISGFGIFTSSRTLLQENNSVQYIDGISSDEDTETNTSQKSDLGMAKFSTKYKPNANNQLDYEILGRFTKESQDQNVLSSVQGNIAEIESSKPYNINQKLEYYYTHNENNIFALEMQHVIKDEDPFYNAAISKPTDANEADFYESTADGLGLDMNQIAYDVAQEKRVKSNQLDAKLDYWNVLNNKSDINFTLGTIYSNQKFNSDIFQFLDDGSTFDPTPNFVDAVAANDVDYTFSDLYLGVHYRLKTGIFTITPGFSVHAYGTENNQLGVDYTDNLVRLLPDFNLRMQLKKSEQITLNYAMQTQFTDVTNFAQGLVLNNYSAIEAGSPLLENALSHNINLSYSSFNMFNYTNVFGSLNYSKNIDQIRNQSQFLEVEDPDNPGEFINSPNRLSTPFNSGFADESFSANGRFQRSFNKLKGTLNGNFNYSKSNQFVNGQRSVNESFSQTYRAGLSSNFREAPNFDVGYRYSVQNNNQGSRDTKYFTNAPSISFDALIFKSFTFKTEYTYNSFTDSNNTVDNTFEFWDAFLAYRKNKDSKWEYEVKATNLLNTTTQSQSSNSTIAVNASEYFIQPRYVTFRVRYSL